jgi:hypothetical protein
LDWYEDWLEKFMMGEVDLPFFQLRNRRPLWRTYVANLRWHGDLSSVTLVSFVDFWDV